MPSRIEDYALLGDCQTAALVDRGGSIDSLCLPRFDSDACFAALLGGPEHGRWLLSPAAPLLRSRRRCREETLVLETEHEVEDGAVTVIDGMPPRGDAPRLVRIVVGTRGRVAMRMQLVIRFGNGAIVPWVRQVDAGIRAVAGPDTLELRTEVPLRGEDLTTVADFTISEGQRMPFVLTWHPSHEVPPPPIDPEHTLLETARWWQGWCARGPAGHLRRDLRRLSCRSCDGPATGREPLASPAHPSQATGSGVGTSRTMGSGRYAACSNESSCVGTMSASSRNSTILRRAA